MKISCDKFYDHSNPHANLLLYSVIVIVSFPVRIYDVLTECSAPRLTVVDACKMEKNRVALFEQMSNASAVFVNIMQTLIATRPNYFFLHPPPSYKTLQGISKTKCWGLVIISHQWKGVGWVGGFWSPNGPPFKIFWPLPPPLPTPRRSMITTRTLLKNKIKKIGKRRRRLYSKAYQQKHLSSSTGWQWAHTADQSNSTGNRCNNVCCDKM